MEADLGRFTRTEYASTPEVPGPSTAILEGFTGLFAAENGGIFGFHERG